MEPFIGEIRIFSGTFAPRGWAFCNGQLLPIVQNTALFSILGTTYGGDGRTTFGLPNLQNRTPMHAGTGSGLTPRNLGEMGGEATTSLTINHLPRHNHPANYASTATQTSPEGAVWASTSRPEPYVYTSSDAKSSTMSPMGIAPTGGNAPHENRQPFITMNFIIALEGVFPIRP